MAAPRAALPAPTVRLPTVLVPLLPAPTALVAAAAAPASVVATMPAPTSALPLRAGPALARCGGAGGVALTRAAFAPRTLGARMSPLSPALANH
jgi:hypothetical protein